MRTRVGIAHNLRVRLSAQAYEGNEVRLHREMEAEKVVFSQRETDSQLKICRFGRLEARS